MTKMLLFQISARSFAACWARGQRTNEHERASIYPMAAEKCPALWPMLLEDLGAMGTHMIFFFIQMTGRPLDVG